MKKVEFIKDYSTKKKGDTAICDGYIASSLISKGVAVIFKEKKVKK